MTRPLFRRLLSLRDGYGFAMPETFSVHQAIALAVPQAPRCHPDRERSRHCLAAMDRLALFRPPKDISEQDQLST